MAAPLEFGVFPRGLAGAPGWVARGRRDDPAAIARALAELSGDGPPLLSRGYVNWTGRWLNKTALAQVRRIAEAGGPPHDLVLCYRDKSGAVQAAPDPAGFWRRVRDLGGADFAAALDYAGLDVYVDVFGPRVGVERVAEVVGWVLRTFRDLRAELNVTHWELFTLRDANSSKDDMFYRFGVLRDDYSPKPAFGVLRDLIAELRQG